MRNITITIYKPKEGYNFNKLYPTKIEDLNNNYDKLKENTVRFVDLYNDLDFSEIVKNIIVSNKNLLLGDIIYLFDEDDYEEITILLLEDSFIQLYLESSKCFWEGIDTTGTQKIYTVTDNGINPRDIVEFRYDKNSSVRKAYTFEDFKEVTKEYMLEHKRETLV